MFTYHDKLYCLIQRKKEQVVAETRIVNIRFNCTRLSSPLEGLTPAMNHDMMQYSRRTELGLGFLHVQDD